VLSLAVSCKKFVELRDLCQRLSSPMIGTQQGYSFSVYPRNNAGTKAFWVTIYVCHIDCFEGRRPRAGTVVAKSFGASEKRVEKTGFQIKKGSAPNQYGRRQLLK
jgi:hypothetical protein